MSDIDKEISEMKLLVNSRARTVAAEFLGQARRRARLLRSAHRRTV